MDKNEQLDRIERKLDALTDSLNKQQLSRQNLWNGLVRFATILIVIFILFVAFGLYSFFTT